MACGAGNPSARRDGAGAKRNEVRQEVVLILILVRNSLHFPTFKTLFQTGLTLINSLPASVILFCVWPQSQYLTPKARVIKACWINEWPNKRTKMRKGKFCWKWGREESGHTKPWPNLPLLNHWEFLFKVSPQKPRIFIRKQRPWVRMRWVTQSQAPALASGLNLKGLYVQQSNWWADPGN